MSKTINPEGAIFATQATEIKAQSVAAVLQLTYMEDCTVPFITRYRKEKTGDLNEEQIRNIIDTYEAYLEREKRRAYILEAITKQEMMTPEIKQAILKAETLVQLEDIYAPFKAKKKTKGMLAKEAGLGPLADAILKGEGQHEEMQKMAETLINPDKKIKTIKDALDGAFAILIETFAHDPEIKDTLRKDYWRDAVVVSSKRPKAEEIKDFEKFKDYFEFEQKASELLDPRNGHRFLAMRRGMTLKVLKVEVQFPIESGTGLIRSVYFDDDKHPLLDWLEACAKKAFTLYIHSSLDLELKSELKKTSDESAIDVFGINLKSLLLQPYLGAKAVLALDPGVRTGCKTAVVDHTGKFLFDTVIYPHEPQRDIQGSARIIERLIEHYNVKHIAVGNGTFGRETLHFLEDHIPAIKKGEVKATLVNESGASIYSASPIAAKEFPNKDATVRGAISIARRFQDPLAELVKIDPKSIGVGQYQHDVNQAKLKKNLNHIVENCVNFVGVDLNTASAPLLSYISGVGPTLAENIVKTREKIGGFKSRSELMDVPRFSQKIFEQSAGFMRIYNGENPLDSTFIHPEKYPLLEKWVTQKNCTLKQLAAETDFITQLEKDKDLAHELGEFTHADIVKSLKTPGQDPRTEFQSTEFRKDIRKMSDLEPGTWYTGIVTNITKFGAFIDIGIKENGLVHVSEMADRFVDNPLEVLKVGQEVKARVIEVDLDRSRIAMSLKKGDSGSVTGTRGGANKKAPKAPRQETKQLKNNAFAALKNLKL